MNTLELMAKAIRDKHRPWDDWPVYEAFVKTALAAIEVTEEMREAGNECAMDGGTTEEIFKAMLAVLVKEGR